MRPTKEQLKKWGFKPAPEDPGDPVRSRARQPARLNQEGGAEQSHRDSVNINSVLGNFWATGQAPAVRRSAPLSGDFSQPHDLQGALNAVRAAEEAFAALPSRIRSAAGNNPVQYLDMIQHPDGVKILRDAGLEVVDHDETEASQSPASSPSPAAQPGAEAPQAPEVDTSST